MAINAPTHGERSHLLHFFHISYVAVASIAANSALNMALVVEVHKIWQYVHVDPLHGLISVVHGCELLDPRRIGFHYPVAVHAHGGGGNICVGAFVYVRMAIEALNLPLAGVQRMAKRKGLSRLVADASARHQK
jgi:hypothetical protein